MSLRGSQAIVAHSRSLNESGDNHIDGAAREYNPRLEHQITRGGIAGAAKLAYGSRTYDIVISYAGPFIGVSPCELLGGCAWVLGFFGLFGYATREHLTLYSDSTTLIAWLTQAEPTGENIRNLELVRWLKQQLSSICPSYRILYIESSENNADYLARRERNRRDNCSWCLENSRLPDELREVLARTSVRHLGYVITEHYESAGSDLADILATQPNPRDPHEPAHY